MFGSSEMYTALNITDITSLLDTYASSPALFSDDLLPQDFGADKKSINYYRVGLYDGGLEYSNYSYSINCRAKSKTESETIAQAVKEKQKARQSHKQLKMESTGRRILIISL